MCAFSIYARAYGYNFLSTNVNFNNETIGIEFYHVIRKNLISFYFSYIFKNNFNI